jgi:molybdenum cofactor cytidylyltransferase
MGEAPLRCAAIVLAAGNSSRLRQPKQLIRINGESLLRRTARLACESGCSQVYVVLGRDAELLAQELRGLGASSLVNLEWSTGMASSLKTGLRAAVESNPELENVMVMVCDQPCLDASILQELLAKHSSRQPMVTACHYGETLGVPAVFSRPVFAELFALSGDQGARRLLTRHDGEVATVEFAGGSFDLDTPEDLARLIP